MLKQQIGMDAKDKRKWIRDRKKLKKQCLEKIHRLYWSGKIYPTIKYNKLLRKNKVAIFSPFELELEEKFIELKEYRKTNSPHTSFPNTRIMYCIKHNYVSYAYSWKDLEDKMKNVYYCSSCGEEHDEKLAGEKRRKKIREVLKS